MLYPVTLTLTVSPLAILLLFVLAREAGKFGHLLVAGLNGG